MNDHDHAPASAPHGRQRRVVHPLVRAPILFLAAVAVPRVAAAQPLWRFSEAPVVSIGEGGGEDDLLFQIGDATRAPDGRLVVLNGGDREVRVYSAAGDLLDVMGRYGAGPGEFLSTLSLRVTADERLLVYDFVGARITIFDLDGGVEDTWRVPRDGGASTPLTELNFRPFADGALPFAEIDIPILEMVQRGGGLHEDEVEIGFRDAGGTRLIVRRSRGPVYATGGSGRAGGLMPPVPFEARILVAAGADGVVVGDSHDPVFRRFDREGEVVAEYTASGTSRRVTARDWSLYKEWFRERYTRPITLPGFGTATNRAEKAEEFLEKAPRGEQMPLFDDLLLDDAGRLWVREYSLEGERVAWQAVAPGGGTIGRIEVPREWSVYEFGEDYVLVRVRDEFDVESVRQYAVER